MLDKKDVEVPYLDRKINYLKIFALLEPENSRFPLEIGMTYFDKGMRLSGLQFTTVSLYRAEKYIASAVQLDPDSRDALYNLGEISYILGKYDQAKQLWRRVIETGLDESVAEKLDKRLQRIEQGLLSHVPAVDYLEVVATAFGLHQQGEDEEASALLLDVLEDSVFTAEFPIPEIWYVLGLCYRNMGMPKYAEDYLKEALSLDPDHADARRALEDLNA
ncbi:tetratricopeptide repeat protein [Geobacter sp. DSM 9736]|uniref:tetratricopeptide repeat protein n=1 Tax=Geobacter sp. DSM 9736 TaxID=1277350 RepID=UPI000B60CB84|nr:tetratricopeptide repeat protein [Geobacter sp. DSM 9736]SNB45790.1 Tetratricopeptide repeat-containing protein [Geobacter sp. DSM 9736]